MVIRRTICGGGGRGGEKRGLRARLVGGLVHFGFHIGRLADGVAQLHDQVVI